MQTIQKDNANETPITSSAQVIKLQRLEQTQKLCLDRSKVTNNYVAAHKSDKSLILLAHTDTRQIMCVKMPINLRRANTPVCVDSEDNMARESFMFNEVRKHLLSIPNLFDFTIACPRATSFDNMLIYPRATGCSLTDTGRLIRNQCELNAGAATYVGAFFYLLEEHNMLMQDVDFSNAIVDSDRHMVTLIDHGRTKLLTDDAAQDVGLLKGFRNDVDSTKLEHWLQTHVHCTQAASRKLTQMCIDMVTKQPSMFTVNKSFTCRRSCYAGAPRELVDVFVTLEALYVNLHALGVTACLAKQIRRKYCI